MNNISGIIVAKNNPPHLFETIDSIQNIVSEIVIVDIGISSEVIERLNKNEKVKIIPCKSDVKYVEQIREKSKEYVSNEYIILLDPDEVVPEKLKEILLKEYSNYDYISIPRKNIIFGKWIEHSRWWPDYQVRFFKKENVIWPEKLHSQPELKGNGFTVEAKEELALVHYNYTDLTEYFEKMIRYARAEATELKNKNESYTLQHAVKTGIQEFISRFFANQGYKDGMHGFVLSFLQMMYSFLVYFYYWESNNYKADEKELNKTIQTYFKQGLYETNHWLEKEKLASSGIKEKILNKMLK